jgi:hypothetical protein
VIDAVLSMKHLTSLEAEALSAGWSATKVGMWSDRVFQAAFAVHVAWLRALHLVVVYRLLCA